MTAQSQPPEKTFLLQDSRGNVGSNLMFWAKKGSYTSNLNEAARFSETEAFSQNDSRASDVPWPAPYVEARARQVVDMQYLKEAEARSTPNEGFFYLQPLPARYDGNDMLFVAKDGGVSSDMAKARVYEYTELFNVTGQTLAGRAWPKTYVDTKTRPAASCKDVELEAALEGLTKKLRKETPPAKERYRCQSCKCFMTVASYYGGHCKRCGTDNRP